MVNRGRNQLLHAPAGSLPPGNVMNAPAGQPDGGNIISAPPGNPAPVAPGPASVAKPKPPPEVVAYLAFVKKIEAHRQMLLRDTGAALMLSQAGGQTQGLLDLIDMASDPDSQKAIDPLADSKAELGRQFKNWKNTLDYFDKQQAPDQCREFSGAYREVLRQETLVIGKLAVDFSKVDVTDPQDMMKLLGVLQKMKGDPTIQKGIDDSADNADSRLDLLVSNYDMEKPFDVPREQKTSGSIMGF